MIEDVKERMTHAGYGFKEERFWKDYASGTRWAKLEERFWKDS